jgi:DnaJ-class molecular chaperone
MNEWYALLEIRRNATKDEIKSAFRKLSLKYHPDKNSTASKEEQEENIKLFHKISEAKEMLLKHNFTKNEIDEVFCDVDHEAMEAKLDEIFKKCEEIKKRQERIFQESLELQKASEKLSVRTDKLESRMRDLRASTTNLKTRMKDLETSNANFEISMKSLEAYLFHHFRPLTDAGDGDNDESHEFAFI